MPNATFSDCLTRSALPVSPSSSVRCPNIPTEWVGRYVGSWQACTQPAAGATRVIYRIDDENR